MEDGESDGMLTIAVTVLAYAFAGVVAGVVLVGLLVLTVRGAVGWWRRR